MHPFRRAVIRITVPRGVVRSTGVSSEKAKGTAAPSPNAAKYRSGPWKGAAETNFLNARLRSTNSGGGQPRSPHEAAPPFRNPAAKINPNPNTSGALPRTPLGVFHPQTPERYLTNSNGGQQPTRSVVADRAQSGPEQNPRGFRVLVSSVAVLVGATPPS